MSSGFVTLFTLAPTLMALLELSNNTECRNTINKYSLGQSQLAHAHFRAGARDGICEIESWQIPSEESRDNDV